MRIVYCGNYRHSFCTEVHLAATLESLGHEVVRCQEDTTLVDTLYSESLQSDLFFYTRTWGHPQQVEFKKMLVDLKAANIKTASYHLDLYVGIRRQHTVVGDPFWMTEYVFTPDGSAEAAAFFSVQGINHHYIKPGVWKEECKPGNFRPELANDVIFVGSESYHEEWPYRGELLAWLLHNYHGRYKRYGGGTEVMRGDPLNDLYASSKVVVGDSLCMGFTKDHYWSDRSYETVGRGGFLIHPYVKGMEEEFETGNQLEFYEFGDWDGLKKLVDHYVENPDEARAIANRGQEFVRENCTYHNRLTQALEILGD